MDRRSVDALVIALASTNGMVLTTTQLLEAGLTPHQIESRTGRLLNRMAQGVFVVGVPTDDARLRAALAALSGAAGSDRTAAHRLGLPVPVRSVVEVVMPGTTRRSMDGVQIRTTRWLPPDDVTVVDGVRVTAVPRTLCDLAASVPRARLRHLIEHALVERLTTALAVEACISAYCRRGRAGSAAVRAVGHQLLASEPVAASALEARGIELFRSAGLHGWVAQYMPPWYDGVRGVVDLAWPELAIVVELDGRRWHATSQAQVEDRRRDRRAAAHGWVTLRFGWTEIVQRPGAVIEECRPVFTARRAEANGSAPVRGSA